MNRLLEQRGVWVAWAGMTVLGLGLVFFRISHGSLWGDEAVSLAMAEHGYGDILRFGKGDSHPPLYHLASKAYADLFGHGRGVFRSFSALGLLASALLLGAGPLSRIFNPRVGLIYAFLMLLSSMNLTQAQEMRMYTWATFLLSACATQGYLYVRDGKGRDLLLFGLASLAGVYIHYYVTLGVFFVHLYLLPWILIRQRSRLWPFLGEALGVVLLFIPWIFTLVTQVTRNVEHFWIAETTVETVLDTLTIPFAVKTGSMAYAPWLALVCFALYGYGLVRAWRRRTEPVFLLMAAGVFLSVLGAVLAFSLTLRPIIVPRYMLSLWGLVFMGVAWGLAQICEWRSRWGRPLAYGFLLLYGLLALPSLNLLYFFQLNGPMDDVKQFGQENFRPGQAFLHFDEITTPTFVVEFPDHPHLVFRSPESIFYDTFDYFGERVRVETDLRALATRYPEIWIVTTPDGPNRQVAAEVSRLLGADPDTLAVWEESAGNTYGQGSLQGTIRFETPLSDFVLDLALVRGGRR